MTKEEKVILIREALAKPSKQIPIDAITYDEEGFPCINGSNYDLEAD